MKKLAIAGASVVLAAMPVVGVFAADPSSVSFTDTLNVTIESGCTLEKVGGTAGDYTQNNRVFSTQITPGNVGYLNVAQGSTVPAAGGGVTVSCNSTDGTKNWTVNVDVTDLTNGTATISGGIATSGATSAWAIKANESGTFTTANNPFADYAAAADGLFLSAATNVSASFNPSYRVYVSPNQPGGLYTGTAVYSITLQ